MFSCRLFSILDKCPGQFKQPSHLTESPAYLFAQPDKPEESVHIILGMVTSRTETHSYPFSRRLQYSYNSWQRKGMFRECIPRLTVTSCMWLLSSGAGLVRLPGEDHPWAPPWSQAPKVAPPTDTQEHRLSAPLVAPGQRFRIPHQH